MERKCSNCNIHRFYKGLKENEPCPYSQNGDKCADNGFYLFIPKKVKTKYKLTEKYKNGFSLLDIAKAKLRWDIFVKVIQLDNTVNVREKYTLEEYNHFETIPEILPWLERNGFIKEDKLEEKWANLYFDSADLESIYGFIHNSKKEASKNIDVTSNYITTIKLPERRNYGI